MTSYSPALLRAEIDAVFADWAWYLDHGDYDAVVSLFTEDALFVSGAAELRGRAAIRNRYTERAGVRSTRHTYSGLRVSAIDGDATSGAGDDSADRTGGTHDAGTGGRPDRVRALSTWVNYAVNAPVPIDDVGVYLVADFDDVLTWCADERWRISSRRIIPVFRDPSRGPATA
jgi:ketosteroid isomerase-like protein